MCHCISFDCLCSHYEAGISNFLSLFGVVLSCFMSLCSHFSFLHLFVIYNVYSDFVGSLVNLWF